MDKENFHCIIIQKKTNLENTFYEKLNFVIRCESLLHLGELFGRKIARVHCTGMIKQLFL